MPADNDQEVFELVDEQDRVVGRQLRSVVHTQGLLHRAVYCWLFDSAGRLLLQRRSAAKKIGPGRWDLSCAEHLQPGESYVQAVQRGLAEELGVSVGLEQLEGPLAPRHRRELHQGQFHDVELVQSFRLDGWDAPVTIDPAEVEEYKFVSLTELQADVQAQPERYTQWLREEGASLGWFTCHQGKNGSAAAAGGSSKNAAQADGSNGSQQQQGKQQPEPAIHDQYDALPF